MLRSATLSLVGIAILDKYSIRPQGSAGRGEPMQEMWEIHHAYRIVCVLLPPSASDAGSPERGWSKPGEANASGGDA